MSLKDIKSFIADLEGLGKVKCITRNSGAICIQEGFLKNQYLNGYREINISAEAGLILNPGALDLRIFFKHWVHVFFIEQFRHNQIQKSFQFFSSDGTAMCKIYLTEDSCPENLNVILNKYNSKNQTPVFFKKENNIKNVTAVTAETNPKEIDLAWRKMKEVHDFYLLMRKYNLERQAIFDMVGDDLAYKVDKDSLYKILSLGKDKGESLAVFIANKGCVQIYTGKIKLLFEKDGWLNFSNEGVRIHVTKEISECWVVRKPSEFGFVTSLEVFNLDGEQVIQVYGQRDEGEPERESWRLLINDL